MQPHEHMMQALKMVDDAMKKPRPDVSAGVAERELGVTGKSDPFEELRLIAANRSADLVLANVEDAVRAALARHDARKHRDDPACDRFEVTTNTSGDVEVDGKHIEIATLRGSVIIHAEMASPYNGWVTIELRRANAIELRDALDVLLRATGEDGDE